MNVLRIFTHRITSESRDHFYVTIKEDSEELLSHSFMRESTVGPNARDAVLHAIATVKGIAQKMFEVAIKRELIPVDTKFEDIK